MAADSNNVNNRYDISDSASLTLPDSDWAVGIWTRPTGSGAGFRGIFANNTYNVSGSIDCYRTQSSNDYTFRFVDDDGTNTGDVTNSFTVAESSTAPWVLIVIQRRDADDEIQFYVGSYGANPTKTQAGGGLTNVDACNGSTWRVGADYSDRHGGEFAEFFISTNASMSSEEVNALARGVCVLDIMGSNLTCYIPLRNNPATEVDVIGGFDAAEQGTTALVEHPPIMGTFAAQYINAPAPVSGGFVPQHATSISRRVTVVGY